MRYTGSDFKKAGGFAFQRGQGSGWTTGCRLKATKITSQAEKKIRSQFTALKKKQYVIFSKNYAATFFEEAKNVYIYKYDSATATLYFLKAHTDGEICVPGSWQTVNFMDATPANPYAKASESELRILGLSRLWEGVKRNFVFMNSVKFNWDSLYVATIPAIVKAKDRDECFMILQRMAAQLNDGHTYVYGEDPRSSAVPMKTVLIGDKVYVAEVSGQSLARKGVRRGMELNKVNGQDAISYGKEQVMPYVSSSTPQWTLHMTYEDNNLLRGKAGEKFSLEFSQDGKNLSVTYTLGEEKTSTAEESLFNFKKLKGGIGYLHIRSFMSSSFYDEFDELYPEILKTPALIIDVRDNHGGNSNYADYILRKLKKDSIRKNNWSSPTYVPAYAS